MGFLLFIEAGLMMLCQFVSWIYDEGVKVFSLAIVLALVLGIIGVLLGLHPGKKMATLWCRLCGCCSPSLA